MSPITIVPLTGSGYRVTIGGLSLVLTREEFSQLSQRVIDLTQAAILRRISSRSSEKQNRNP